MGEAPLTIVIVAELDRCQSLVESDYKHCLLVDAGCMVQACQLATTALGLASVARASFQAQAIVEAIGRQPEEFYLTDDHYDRETCLDNNFTRKITTWSV